jgi:hypothetical protein
MIRYIFVVRDLHPLLLAGFTGALHMSTARLFGAVLSLRQPVRAGTRLNSA